MPPASASSSSKVAQDGFSAGCPPMRDSTSSPRVARSANSCCTRIDKRMAWPAAVTPRVGSSPGNLRNCSTPATTSPTLTRTGKGKVIGMAPACRIRTAAGTRGAWSAWMEHSGRVLARPPRGGLGPTMDRVTSPRRRVLLARPRGYCAGVDRAVVTVEKALEQYGAPIYVRKQIVHNKHVVATLEQRGAIFVDETAEVPEGALVVFSAHGVSPAVHEEAAERQLRVIDATCPLVTKVHKEAVRYAREGYDILLVGHRGHEEVEGTQGEAPEAIQLVDSAADVDGVHVDNPDKVVWLSQTTLCVDETLQTVDLLRKRFPLMTSPPSDDICYATQNRQEVVKQIAPECDLVIVVGSRNSSNSVRLVEVALDAGARAAHLVDYAHEIDASWLSGVSTIGVTSGASVPEDLVEGVLEWLAGRGFGDVEEFTAATETLTFSLPKELRKDLRPA